MSACDNDLKISAFSDMLVHNKATVCVLIKKHTFDHNVKNIN